MTVPAPALEWRCGARTFDLARRVLVMGIVNVTPDSFSDGGRFLAPGAALDHARRLLEEGADVLDVGAESTRPGAEPVPPEEQWRRLGPVIGPLAAEGACVSVDTASAAVAARALDAGAVIVNDVTALRDPGMAELVAARGAGLVLMHMRGTPRTMQLAPRYGDVATDVIEWLRVRLRAARRAGIQAACIALDPGIGFGKTVRHNLELLARLDELAAFGRPVLVGVSRKSFLGKTLELPVDERLEGGLAATAIAVFQGARIVRTHDVRATVRAVRIAEELRDARRDRPPAPADPYAGGVPPGAGGASGGGAP
uniref:Dihydropteroate synthase n=1 Tax=Eiseniibacteriota bacterium TaxID=2212470 RepID=A0A832ML61_UNCEI